jgi:general nucleoside transport system permease protein
MLNFRFRLEPREEPSRQLRLAAPVIAIAVSIAVSCMLFAAVGLNPVRTLFVMFVQPLGSMQSIGEVVLKASPLILIALGLSVGFRANVWNIGADGMFIVGALCAGALALSFGREGGVWLLPVMVIAGAFGGMAVAAVSAYLRTAFNASEILVTMMLNYLAALSLAYVVRGPWRDPQGYNYPQTEIYDPSALFLPLVDGLRLNSSIFITAAAVPLAWFFMERTFAGYKLALGGTAPRAARFAGFSEHRAIWLGMLAGGAAAGIAGVAETSGVLGQLSPNITPGYGFAAIIVAFIGRLNAFGIVAAGFLMALMYIGGESAQVELNLPASVSRAFQGMLLLFLLTADALVLYRVRRSRS